MKRVLMVFVALALAGSVSANEKEFVKRVLGPKIGAGTYVKLQDGTTADILTPRFVAAVAFPENWTGALGRVLHGHNLTGRTPVVVLLQRDCPSEADRLHTLSCQALCGKVGIACIVEQYTAPPYDKKPTPADEPPKRDPRKT